MDRRRKRIIMVLVAAGLLAVGLFATLNQYKEPEPGPIYVPRSLPAWVTPQYGFVANSTINNSPRTPMPRPTYDPLYPGNYPIGMECQEYMSAVWPSTPTGGAACASWPCSTSNITWTEYDNCINAAAAYTVTIRGGTVISQPVVLTIPGRWSEAGGSGTSGAPYNQNFMPAWMNSAGFSEVFTRTSGNTYYTGINYDNTSFLNRMKQMVAEAGARYNDDENVAAVRANIGWLTETQPLQCDAADKIPASPSNCVQKTLMSTHETKVASCTAYRNFVIELANAVYDAFPNKPVLIGAGTSMCGGHPYYDNAWEVRKYLWEDPATGWNVAATPRALGYAYHGMAPDNSQADGYTTDPWTNYKHFTFAEHTGTYTTPVPIMFENAGQATSYSDPWQAHTWMAYAVAALGGDAWLPTTGFITKFTDEIWRMVDNAFGTNADYAWIVFRDGEWDTYMMNNVVPIYDSGYRGDFGEYLVVQTPTAYPQYCDDKVVHAAETAVFAAKATPIWKPCGITNGTATPFYLPTPKATYQPTPSPDATSQYNVLQRIRDRQARRIEADDVMGIAVDADWTYYGDTMNAALSLDYLDIGTANISVYVWRGDVLSWATETITRTNTGLWQRHTWNVANAVLSNGISISGRGYAFAGIYGGGTDVTYVGDLAFTVTDVATATPTPTPTGTVPTPTATWTPSPTPTSTTTATPTATPTAAWTVQACPTMAVTVDADLSEWTAVTPVALSGTPGAYAYYTDLDGTPSAVSGSFYCAHDSTNLYISGAIVDATVRNAPYGLESGDAVELAIDGWADGMNAPMVDDHALIINTLGRAYDFTIYAPDVTVKANVSAPTGDGWEFEIMIPADLLADPDATWTSGQQLGITYTIINRDTAWATGVTYDDLRTGYKHSLRLE